MPQSSHGAVVAAVVAMLAAGAACASPARVAGTITRAAGDAIVVTTADARAENVHVDASTRISIRTPADHSILEKGRLVGATATPQPDGSLLASEVHVFPESRRASTQQGHHPMSGRPAGTTMTNATVGAVTKPAPRPTGNATVAAASAAKGAMRLTLDYPGGSQTIVVPDGVPVVTMSDGDRSALVAGAHVIVSGERGSDGTIAAARINVGAHGSVPPM
jgi:hypothetical protein